MSWFTTRWKCPVGVRHCLVLAFWKLNSSHGFHETDDFVIDIGCCQELLDHLRLIINKLKRKCCCFFWNFMWILFIKINFELWEQHYGAYVLRNSELCERTEMARQWWRKSNKNYFRRLGMFLASIKPVHNL